MLVGLDYPLQSSSMAGFSDLDYREIAVSAGLNYRVTNHAIFTSTISLTDLDDKAPYIVDVSGKHVNVFAGMRWLF